MKKIVCFLLAAVFSLTAFVSCGSGTSIAIGALRLDNEVLNLFKFTDAVAYQEMITYYDETENPVFSVEYYYEKSEDIYVVYNLSETIGKHALYAYEGNVYAENAEGITVVLLLGGTYTNFLTNYMDASFPLDGDSHIQRNAETKDGITMATYESVLTPQQTARASGFGVQEGDKIISVYQVKGNLIESIRYQIERDGKLSGDIAKREFTVWNEKPDDRFVSLKSLPEESIGVDFVFVGQEAHGRHFEIPKGFYMGVDTGAHLYTFYLDEELQREYSFGDEPITEPLTLYIVEES